MIFKIGGELASEREPIILGEELEKAAATTAGDKEDIARMFELFDQQPKSRFKPTNYNPFEVKHRKRTSAEQFAALEEAFSKDQRPPLEVRRRLAGSLGMTNRAVQVWFQNRRAKLKGKTNNPAQKTSSEARTSRSASCPNIAQSFERLQAVLSGETTRKEAATASRTVKRARPLADKAEKKDERGLLSQPAPPSPMTLLEREISYFNYFDTLNLMPPYIDSIPMTPQSTLFEDLISFKSKERITAGSADDMLLNQEDVLRFLPPQYKFYTCQFK